MQRNKPTGYYSEQNLSNVIIMLINMPILILMSDEYIKTVLTGSFVRAGFVFCLPKVSS